MSIARWDELSPLAETERERQLLAIADANGRRLVQAIRNAGTETNPRVLFDFYLDNVPKNQTEQALNTGRGSLDDYVLPRQGYIRGIAIGTTNVISSGTITAYPANGGTVHSSAGGATIPDGGTLASRKLYTQGDISLVSTDSFVWAAYSSSSGLAPDTTIDIIVTLLFEFTMDD